jgi:propionyl-CoA carboxylase alpha chain
VQSSIPAGWRNVPSQLQRVAFRHGERQIDVGYSTVYGPIEAEIEGRAMQQVRLTDDSTPERVGLEVDGHLRWFGVKRNGDRRHISMSSGSVELVVIPRFPVAEGEDEPGSLHAPMPGKVIAVHVHVGQHVLEGAPLVVMEAMKMEHTLRAPFAGEINSIRCQPGDQVDADATLVVVASNSVTE